MSFQIAKSPIVNPINPHEWPQKALSGLLQNYVGNSHSNKHLGERSTQTPSCTTNADTEMNKNTIRASTLLEVSPNHK